MKELSPLARQLLGGGNEAYVKLYTQQEYDGAVALAKAEIITVAIEATTYAIGLEREACATMADECVNIEELGQAIRDRGLGKTPTK